jgi:CheY-like chemotaxis protein
MMGAAFELTTPSKPGAALRFNRNPRTRGADRRRAPPPKPARPGNRSCRLGADSMNDKIRILVAEDHLVARVGISAIINRQPDMLVVAEASNGRQAVERYREHLPDVALLDLRMPLLSGVEVAIAIRREFPDARLIALTSYGGDEDIRRTLAAGASLPYQGRSPQRAAPHHSNRAWRRNISSTFTRGGPGSAKPFAGVEPARDRSIATGGSRLEQQTDRLFAGDYRDDCEKSRPAHFAKAGSTGQNASHDGCHSAGHHPFVRSHNALPWFKL